MRREAGRGKVGRDVVLSDRDGAAVGLRLAMLRLGSTREAAEVAYAEYKRLKAEQRASVELFLDNTLETGI